jgi:predicted nuclease of restriction endonuclease-like (RecB) superfamily
MGAEAGQAVILGEDYARLLADVRAIIAAGRGRAAAAVNRELVATYWAVGERIVREEQGGAARAAYGEQVLARLGRALEREFGRGFGLRSLQLMRQFYLAYPIANAVRSELGWTHYRSLMRLPDPEQREFYGRLAATGRWSSRELDRQIGARLFERVGLSRRAGDLAATLPAPVPGERAPVAADVFKDPYILDFLGLEDTYSEQDLEAAIVRHIERFLLELGTDFCFVARQRRLTIDGEDYYVDLVFYHRSLRCLVLVDLKLGAFAPADAAQMQLYLEWTKRHDRRAGEEDPIGLILCGSRGAQVVELLLSSQTNRMKVAQYLLPEDTAALKARLAQITAADEQRHAGAGEAAVAPGDGEEDISL